MKGKQRRVELYKNGEYVKTYETMVQAEREYFSDKPQEYLSFMFRKHNGIFTKGDLTFVKTNERGITKNYRKYFVHDKISNKKFVVVGTGEMLKIVNYGHDTFYRQFKRYGNYQDPQYSVWRMQ